MSENIGMEKPHNVLLCQFCQQWKSKYNVGRMEEDHNHQLSANDKILIRDDTE